MKPFNSQTNESHINENNKSVIDLLNVDNIVLITKVRNPSDITIGKITKIDDTRIYFINLEYPNVGISSIIYDVPYYKITKIK